MSKDKAWKPGRDRMRKQIDRVKQDIKRDIDRKERQRQRERKGRK